MKNDDLKQLLKNFSSPDFREILTALKAARKDGPEAVFQTLEKSLDAPGITAIPQNGVASGHVTAGGLKVPDGPETWPMLVAEIHGNGVDYIKTEQIRGHIIIVPLRLDTRTPRLAGAAMAAALLKAYGKFLTETGRQPQRSIRFIFTPCSGALEEYLTRPRALCAQAFSAMELDLSFTDTTRFSIDSANGGRRSFVTEALLELLKNTQIKERKDAIRSITMNPYNVPFAKLSGSVNSKSARSVGNALLKSMILFGDTNYEDGLKFMRPRIRRAATAMKAEPKKAQKIYSELLDITRGFDQLMHRGPWWSNPKATILRHRKQGILVDGIYYPRFAYQAWQTAELKKLQKLLPPAKRKAPPEVNASPAILKRAKQFVPARTFAGMLGPDGFKDGVEPWMQTAANLAKGKKTVVEIFQGLEKSAPDLKALLHFFQTLEKLGRVKRKPIITADQIRKSLKDAGIEKGDTVVIHAGYASYGYIECGPKGLIELFLEAVGPEGTVCMPTHTGGLVGGLPFEPNETPAITGLVPNLFAKYPGVIRSAHPTHSVAAIGPNAEYLLERSIPAEPIFGDEGFWGRLLKLDGKILMFCNSLGPNTILHGVDYWSGTALPDALAHLIEDGERKEVVIHSMPFHIDSFQHIYKSIEKKPIIRKAPLGTGTVYAMKARELKKAGMKVVKKNPLLATAPGCDCDYCAHLKRAEARRKKEKR